LNGNLDFSQVSLGVSADDLKNFTARCAFIFFLHNLLSFPEIRILPFPTPLDFMLVNNSLSLIENRANRIWARWAAIVELK
jgi:hypothetical protein